MNNVKELLTHNCNLDLYIVNYMSETNWNKILEDRVLKIATRILAILALTIVVVLSIITFFKMFKGEHVKLFGLEYNIPKEHPDTVFKKEYIETNVLKPIKQDLKPASQEKQFVSGFGKRVIISSRAKLVDSTNKLSPSISQTNKNGTNEVNTNNGNNLGNIGGNNNTVNNFGIQPRKITNGDLLPIINQLNDKNVRLVFVSYGFADAEINSVKNQIASIFKGYGFNNIERAFHTVLGKEPPLKIEPRYFQNENVLEFHIPPAPAN